MLIVFDLDDTLIDTSGSITPIQLKKALRHMQQKGLVLDDFEEALKELLSIDERAKSAQDSLCIFLDRMGQLDFLQLGVESVYKNLSDDIKVRSLENASEILKDLSKDHRLAIVSKGEELLQGKKLKKAGIDSALFSKIIVTDGDKKKCYRSLLNEFPVDENRACVCADRIERDLRPAKELGMTTVHMKWGRGRYLSDDRYVDYAVSSLCELKKIITTITE